LRRRPPSAIAAPPPPRLAENHSRPPSPAARPIPIFLRSSVPLPRFRSKFSQLHLSRTAPMTTSTPPQPYTADQSENSTTSVDANTPKFYELRDVRFRYGRPCGPHFCRERSSLHSRRDHRGPLR